VFSLNTGTNTVSLSISTYLAAPDQPDFFAPQILLGDLTDFTGTIHFSETITNTNTNGALDWEEWAQTAVPIGTGSISWSNLQADKSGFATDVSAQLGVPGIVWNFSPLLAPGESVLITKDLSFTSYTGSVLVSYLPAALPLPPAVWLLGSALAAIVMITRRRAT
jgi:hypothetical protein